MEKIERDVMGLLQNNSAGLEFLEILARLGEDSERVYKCLEKLKESGLVAFDDRVYKVTDSSQNVAIFKAKCPMCGTVRIVTRPTQAIVRCSNYDCKTKSGLHRTFWIIKRKIKNGIVTERRINLAE